MLVYLRDGGRCSLLFLIYQLLDMPATRTSVYCHTETKGTEQTRNLTHSQYADTGSTSPSTDPYNARRQAKLLTF